MPMAWSVSISSATPSPRNWSDSASSSTADAKQGCWQVLHEEHPLKSLPLKGLVGRHLPFDQFLAHMLHQARAHSRFRSLQERRWRTASFAAP